MINTLNAETFLNISCDHFHSDGLKKKISMNYFIVIFCTIHDILVLTNVFVDLIKCFSYHAFDVFF